MVAKNKSLNAPVQNDVIAKSLTVNEPFTERMFAHLTGINPRSANARANKLVRDDCLTKIEGSKPIKFKMTVENRHNMLLDHKINKMRKRKGFKRCDLKPSTKRMTQLFEQARRMYCELMLKRGGLM